ncbi:YcnI family protein [Brevibacillus sp. B_LB10_24]|jgi:uncharacterized protein YcnI|uniref:YcnI family copper-binding membrane protein n=1 Tax=Brevibacillus TaxID=55080 RepID=UPI0002F01EA6|nr:YcnI family protein [Brevibacillus massiliensis]
MKLKKWISIFVLTGVLCSTAGIASAHVTVWPKTSTTGAYEKYTVRVPVEKESNTTEVRLEFPEGVKVGTVMPTPGWSYAFENDSEGRPKALVWKAENGGIKPHEFMEFSFVGANPKTAGSLAWKAYQTYADGSVVEWTGAPGTETPASVTTIEAGQAEGDGHDHGTEKAAEPQNPAASDTPANAAAPAPAADKNGTGSTLPLVLSGLALLLSIISLLRKRQ